MPFTIPNCFLLENEDFITISPMKRFCDINNLKKSEIRSELLTTILAFANNSPENEEITVTWLNKVLKEGLKHIYIKRIYFPDPLRLECLKNPDMVHTTLNSLFPKCPQVPIIFSHSTGTLTMQNYSWTISEGHVSKLSFEFTKLITCPTSPGSATDYDHIIYPIYVDIDLENGLIMSRGKSKSKMFDYTPTHSAMDNIKKNTKDLVTEAVSSLYMGLRFAYEQRSQSDAYFKRALYDLFKQTTFTPEFIQEKVQSFEDTNSTFIDQAASALDIKPEYFDKMKQDLNILLEKYISLSDLTEGHILADRDIYPIKMAATDFEYTKHSTTAAKKRPLQCKEKFFDLKNSLDYSKSCDMVTFCFKRLDSKYFSNELPSIGFEIADGWCIIKLLKYIEEEDIEHVLSRFITT